MPNFSMADADASKADEQLIIAVLTWITRPEHLRDGVLGEAASSGFLDRCLQRLKHFDLPNAPRGGFGSMGNPFAAVRACQQR